MADPAAPSFVEEDETVEHGWRTVRDPFLDLSITIEAHQGGSTHPLIRLSLAASASDP